jgi:hypothetical protein
VDFYHYRWLRLKPGSRLAGLLSRLSSVVVDVAAVDGDRLVETN